MLRLHRSRANGPSVMTILRPNPRGGFDNNFFFPKPTMNLNSLTAKANLKLPPELLLLL
jgi:hypothetical protein